MNGINLVCKFYVKQNEITSCFIMWLPSYQTLLQCNQSYNSLPLKSFKEPRVHRRWECDHMKRTLTAKPFCVTTLSEQILNFIMKLNVIVKARASQVIKQHRGRRHSAHPVLHWSQINRVVWCMIKGWHLCTLPCSSCALWPVSMN